MRRRELKKMLKAAHDLDEFCMRPEFQRVDFQALFVQETYQDFRVYKRLLSLKESGALTTKQQQELIAVKAKIDAKAKRVKHLMSLQRQGRNRMMNFINEFV